MEIDIQPAQKADGLELARDLLKADREEILSMGLAPEWAVLNSIETSLEAVTFRANGELVSITGVCRTISLDERVYPWMVSTPRVLLHRRAVVEYSRKILDHWLSQYPYMTNYVDQRHTRAVNWLKWLGAELTPLPEFGPYKRPFYQFSFGAPHVC